MSKRVEGKAYKRTQRERASSSSIVEQGGEASNDVQEKKTPGPHTPHVSALTSLLIKQGPPPPESFKDTCRQKETTFCENPESSGLNYRNVQRRQRELEPMALRTRQIIIETRDLTHSIQNKTQQHHYTLIEVNRTNQKKKICWKRKTKSKRKKKSKHISFPIDKQELHNSQNAFQVLHMVRFVGCHKINGLICKDGTKNLISEGLGCFDFFFNR